ncbi:MAG: hypothetical protein CBB97_13805 [Candidatus Endolissoclinum sp. TMED37]|nr:MAG: hypothetical protein CBB97_13805 [Candidatus Endolissoclinum sp. TMED37]
MKKIAILQPHYIPWLGYFSLIEVVDEFIFLDDVQFIKREWKNRNKIRKDYNSSETKWLSIPILGSDIKEKKNINNTQIEKNYNWKTSHLNSIKQVYAKSPFFETFFPFLEKIILNNNKTKLSEFNIELIKKICDYLKINYFFSKSSDYRSLLKREYKLRELCKMSKASIFIANNATGDYVDKDFFEIENIKFELQHYSHPLYNQYYNNKKLQFLSHLSIVDLIFNEGENSKQILVKGTK